MQREVVLAIDEERLYGHSSHSSEARIKEPLALLAFVISVPRLRTAGFPPGEGP
jgi:hypothetical protein